MEIYQLVLIVISIILVKNLFSSKSIEKNTYNNSKDIISSNVINKEIKKSMDSTINKKRVTFNLDNNQIYEIKKIDKNIDPKNKNFVYGDQIIDKNKIVNYDIKSDHPQQILLNRLNLKKDEVLENTKDIYSYWENLNRGNFIDRQYLNVQVNDFNKFKSNDDNYNNKEISKVYDELTKGQTNPYINLHDDLSINKEKTFIDGFSSSCKYHNLNNIEN